MCSPGEYFKDSVCTSCDITDKKSCFLCNPLKPSYCIVCNQGYY